MIWGKKKPMGDQLLEWHLYFKWLPVQLEDGRWAMWQVLERKRVPTMIGGYWKYREAVEL